MRTTRIAIASAIFFSATSVLAQQPICIPGTTYCLPSQMNGQAGGGANGNVGPNGANGGARGAATGSAAQPQPPPPQYRPAPPPSTPTYTPPPPRTQQPQIPPAPTAPAPSPPTTYSPPDQPYRRSTDKPGIGLYPIMRVGTDSGFHFGGAFSFGLHEPYWGLELDTMFLRGGVVTMTDISFVPSFVFRFGPDDDPAVFDGFYALVGPEFRFSWADDTPPNASHDGQIFHIGVQAGVGFEHTIATDISWKILEARAVGAWRTDSIPPADDDFGHKSEYGVLFMSGVTFY